MINPFEFLKNAKNITSYLEQVKKAKSAETHEVEVAAGQVSIKINGNFECLDLKIDPQLLKPEELTTLSDYLKSAFNAAVKKAKEEGSDELLLQAQELLASGKLDMFNR